MTTRVRIAILLLIPAITALSPIARPIRENNWMRKDEGAEGCPFPSAFCVWRFEPQNQSASTGTVVVGMVIAKVTRNTYFLACPGTPSSLHGAEYFEVFQIIDAATEIPDWAKHLNPPPPAFGGAEDTFTTVPVGIPLEQFQHIFGESKYIALTAASQALFNELTREIATAHNRTPTTFSDGAQSIVVTDSQGNPVQHGDSTVTTGLAPNSPYPPSGSNGETWENNYGGFAVPLNDRSLRMDAACCGHTNDSFSARCFE